MAMIECISLTSSSSHIDDLSDTEVTTCTDYNGLCEPQWIQCDFCDKVFQNSYTHIKHNASHIIIPLVKITQQCQDCLRHFTSNDELESHITTAHHKLINIEIIKQEKDILMQSLVEKEVFVKCEDDIKDLVQSDDHLRTFNEYDEKQSMKFKGFGYKSQNSNKQIIGQYVKKEPEVKILNSTETVRNRLLFEDDDDIDLISLDHLRKSKIIIHDTFKYESGEPINQFDKEIKTSHHTKNELDNLVVKLENSKYKSDDTTNESGIAISKLYNSINVSGELMNLSYNSTNCYGQVNVISSTYEDDLNSIYSESVHYQDLLKPEKSRCRHCDKCFPNRFELIKHESRHISFRKCRQKVCVHCERYISGNYRTLRRHMDTAHPGRSLKKLKHNYCKKCNLPYFNYTRHLRLYHYTIPCHDCDQIFEDEAAKNVHKCRNLSLEIMQKRTDFLQKSSEMKLCKMCFSFMKGYIMNRVNTYVVLGEYSEMGVMHTCKKCNSKSFAVVVIQRRNVVKKHGRPQKGLTNKDRLERVQQRLKLLKNRNKF